MSNLTVFNPDQVMRAQSQLSTGCLEKLNKSGKLSLIEDVENRDLIKRECVTVLAASTPATPSQLREIIIRQLGMYDSFDRRSEASKTLVVDEWRDALQGWPVDILTEARKAYRDSDKASFMPQPGDILSLAREKHDYRMALAQKARDLLEYFGDISA